MILFCKTTIKLIFCLFYHEKVIYLLANPQKQDSYISGKTFEDLVKNTEESLPEQIDLMKEFGAPVAPEFYGHWNLGWHLSERAEFLLD